MKTIDFMPNNYCPRDCKWYNPIIQEIDTTNTEDTSKTKIVILKCSHEDELWSFGGVWHQKCQYGDVMGWINV